MFLRIPQPKEGRPVAVGFGIIKALKEKLRLHEKDHPEKVSFFKIVPHISLKVC